MTIFKYLTAICLLTISQIGYAATHFQSDFSDMSVWHNHISGGTVTNPGNVGKFNLPRVIGQDTYRAEVFPEGKAQLPMNVEHWLSMDYNRTSWSLDRSAEGAPFQMHRVPSIWKAGCGGEVSAYSAAPFLMYSKNGVEQVVSRGQILWQGPIVENKWQNIIFHFSVGWSSSNFIEAWKDGVKLFRVTGPNHAQIDDCGQPFKDPTFNIGIYKWDWKAASTQISDSTIRTLLIDNVLITNGPTPIVYKSPDSTPPIVSNLVTTSVTQTSGTISWGTNELAKGSITINGNTVNSTDFTTTKSFNIVGLSPNISYPFSITSTDASNNVRTVTGILVTLADTLPPVITVGNLDITYYSAKFSWTTNELASSRVRVFNSSYPGTPVYSAILTNTHSITIPDLPADTQFNYNIRSVDASGNISNFDGVLRTLPIPDTTPPVISGVVDSLTDSSLTVSWSTNEAATSRVVLDGVEYLDNNLSTSHEVLLPMAFGQHVITVSSKDAAGNVSDDIHTITIGACLK